MSGSRERIFISYRRKGGAHTAQAISDALSDRFGRDVVFFDVQSIDAGAAYPDRLRDGLLHCDLMIVVIDPFWLDIRHEDGRRRLDDPGDWVRLEVEAALREGKTVVPLLAISARMPGRDELPEPIAALADRQALMLRWGRDFRHDIDGLIEAAEKILGPAKRQPSFWLVPHHQNRFFTGREQLLADVRSALDRDGIAVLRGLGGIGKTGVAVEYAYRQRDDYTAVFWVRAETATDLFAGFVEIARLLDLPQKDLADQDEAVQAVRRWLDNHDGWLLVLDNLDAPELAVPFLPQHRRGHVLVTSRAAVFDTLGVTEPLAVRTLSHEDSLSFLLKRTDRQHSSQPELAAAAELILELDGLPLAIEQAAAYLCRHRTTFADYLAGYRRRHGELLNKIGPQSGEYSETVATTWSLSFQRIEETSPASGELLRFIAFLSPDKIPLELLTLGGAELGETLAAALDGADALAVGELLEPLTRHSLVEFDLESDTCSVHRIVQQVLQANMDEQTRRNWAECVVRAVNAANLAAVPDDVEFSNWGKRPVGVHFGENWAMRPRLFHQALAAASLIDTWNLSRSEAGSLLHHVAGFLASEVPSAPDFQRALQLSQRALQILEKALGSDHPKVAASLNNLAILHYSQGKYDAAERMWQRALAIRDKALGPDHPGVARSLWHLAALYLAQGKYDTAEPMYQKALAILSAAPPGSQYPDMADTLLRILLGLAKLYDAQGRSADDIESAYRRALNVSNGVLADVGNTLHCLGLARYERGEYAQAELMYQGALAIQEKALGPEHPDTLLSLNNLAVLYRDQGRYAEAEPLYQRALAILENSLVGAEHPEAATVLGNYAVFLRDTGRAIEAELYEARAREIPKQGRPCGA